MVLSSTTVFANETTKFAGLKANTKSFSTTILFGADKTTSNAFTLSDKETENDFSVQDDENNAKNQETKLTENVIQEDVAPEITQIHSIIKTEIKRQEDEKIRAEQEALRKQQEEEQRRKEQEAAKKKSQATKQTPVKSSSGSTNNGSLQGILEAQLGKPYVWGGNGPKSFDCSGLVKYVYAQLGITLPRTAAAQQTVGTSVERSIDSLKYGDLVFFAPPGSTYATHVGIYVGNGNMIHAPQTGDVVKYTNIFSGYYKNRFFSAKRVL